MSRNSLFDELLECEIRKNIKKLRKDVAEMHDIKNRKRIKDDTDRSIAKKRETNI